ncbi:hypothetical protein [Nonomuraea sp. NPDC003214]
MDLAHAPIRPPEGVTDVSAWSLACATAHHELCKGVRLNPDRHPPADATLLPCACTVCAGNPTHTPKRRGRPPKNKT